MSGSLSDGDVTRLLPILAARSRASQQTSGSFRPPRVGLVEQVGADWHHFVVGRRGVGKSMLLLNVAARSKELGKPVAYIDIETLRDNPYPDVLIRLLIRLSAELRDNLSGFGRPLVRRQRANRRLKKLEQRLDNLLKEPQETSYQNKSMSRRGRKRAGGSGVSLNAGTPSIAVTAEATAASVSDESTTLTSEATFVKTKLEGLHSEATEFREILGEAVAATGNVGVLIILDDFYFIPREHQPDVLSYLHQVVKNLGIWLKIGAVEHRLNEFEDGDPPRGLQLTQDAARIPMDVTLADFDHTRSFLESILSDICTEAIVNMDDLMTDGAKLRLVLASGGVPRDYLNLISAALDKATRRTGEPNRPKNRITAEDVNVAVPSFLKQKEDDLRVDAKAEDIDRLRSRLYDILNFCLVSRKTNVFTVDARLLREEEWGRDIAALRDLRFFHGFGNLTVKSSNPGYVGQRYEGFALDLSAYAATRVRTNEIEFWTTDGFQKCRSISHVYSPEISADLTLTKLSGNDEGGTVDTVVNLEKNQISIFDELDDSQSGS